MKKILLLIGFTFLLQTIFSQSLIESEVQNIVKTQIFVSSEETVPVIIPLPFFVYVGSYTFLDNEVYFETDEKSVNQQINYSEIVKNELYNNLPLRFSITGYPDFFKINTFLNDNLPVSVDVSKNDDELIFKVISSNGTFSRESTFIDDRPYKIQIKNRDGTELTQYEYSNEKLRIYNFKSFDNFYRIIDKIYNGNLVTKQIYYKKSKSIENLKVKFYTDYRYDSNGKLTSIVTRNSKNKIIDSTGYTYIDNSIIEYYERAHNKVQTTCLFDSTDRILTKYISNGITRIRVNYLYDNTGKLNIIDIDNENTSEKTRLEFSFLGDKFIEFKKYYYREGSASLELAGKITFKYNSENILENVTILYPNGSIDKTLRYEFNK